MKRASSVRTLSRQGRWLLLHIAERHPRRIATTTPLHCDIEDKPGMGTLKGLERRGWVECDRNYLYGITASGLEAAARLKERLEEIKNHPDDGTQLRTRHHRGTSAKSSDELAGMGNASPA